MLTEREKDMRQRILCQKGEHLWTQWGPFIAICEPLTPASFKPDFSSDKPKPLRAFRSRRCQCGVVQRERWSDHVIETYPPSQSSPPTQ